MNMIINHPISTEKAVRVMQSENKLVFQVTLKAKKAEIKKAVENVFDVKVESVNTLITPQGKKKAYVKLTPEFQAIDVATDLGLM